MKNIKRIQIFVFILFPSCLLGMHNNLPEERNWIQEALACPHAGAWTTQDNNGKTVIVEGEVISTSGTIISSEADIRKLAFLFAEAMEETFVDLSKNSLFWLSYIKCRDLLAGKSHRDRLYDAYIEKMSTALSQDTDGFYYVFTVSDLRFNGTKKILGAVLFDIKKEFAYGTVELDLIAIKQEDQSRGLSTILAGSIFNFLPQIKRMILDVLYTNKKAKKVYKAFGFTKYVRNSVLSFVDPEYHYEYLTDLPKCQKLQARAAMFKEVEGYVGPCQNN